MRKVKKLLVVFLIILPALPTTLDFEEALDFKEALDKINEVLLREYLEVIVGFGPRVTGSPSCEKAASYIYNKFVEMGLKTRYHNWSTSKIEGKNVEGTLRGFSDKIIILNAHYDTVENSPGANDDGSGIAALLAAAFVLSNFKFEHTIRFVAFSGEEIGRLGSHEYAKRIYEKKENIIVELNADVIGYAQIGEGMWVTATEDAEWLLGVAENLSLEYSINLQIYTGSISRDGYGWSDYFSFVEYGYEAIAFWGGEWDPNEHTPEDDLDNINFSYLVKTSRIITAMLAFIASTTKFYPQIRIEYPRLGKLYFRGITINISDLSIIVIGDIWVRAEEKLLPIKKVEFYYDEKLGYIDKSHPFEWYLNQLSIWKHRIKVIGYDEYGRKTQDWRDILFINL